MEMGNNEGSVEATLGQRGSVYGNYADVIKTRAEIMGILENHHKRVQEQEMSEEMKIALGDIVLKLVRGSGSLNYPDSWHDLAGYATLVEKLAIDANKGGYEL